MKHDDYFEVIDGQQRLTTLFIMLSVMNKKLELKLSFEARPSAERILSDISTNNIVSDDSSLYQAWQYFQSQTEDLKKLDLSKIELLRIIVPEHTDVNHYFEIMNTRGKQLELHEILKAEMISKLDGRDRKWFNTVWTVCSNMEYDVDDKVVAEAIGEECDDCFDNNVPKSLAEAIQFYDHQVERVSDRREDKRYTRILTFPQFLMHVLQICKPSSNREYPLDDKRLLQHYRGAGFDDRNSVMDFADSLLKIRQLFDRFVIKRPFDEQDHTEDDWYITENDVGSMENVMMLQAMLRVTYISPQSMDWITLLLKDLNEGHTQADYLQNKLEDYCKGKMNLKVLNDNQSMHVPWLYFNYLEYLLWRCKSDELDINHFRFRFNNSIEHFYPQNPKNLERMDNDYLNSFGNLFLITQAENSKLSNNSPHEKIEILKKNKAQSLKLQSMINKLQGGERSIEFYKKCIDEHHNEMINILKNDYNKDE